MAHQPMEMEIYRGPHYIWGHSVVCNMCFHNFVLCRANWSGRQNTQGTFVSHTGLSYISTQSKSPERKPNWFFKRWLFTILLKFRHFKPHLCQHPAFPSHIAAENFLICTNKAYRCYPTDPGCFKTSIKKSYMKQCSLIIISLCICNHYRGTATLNLDHSNLLGDTLKALRQESGFITVLLQKKLLKTK